MKKLSLFILSIFALAVVLANVVITPHASNPSGTTNESIINVSYTIDTDFLNNTIFNWNGTNYSFYDDSLVLFYNFDNRSSLGETNLSVHDLSIYQNNGSFIGSQVNWTSSGKYGGGYYFTANNYYLNVTKRIDYLATNFTIGFWAKTNATGTGIWMFSVGNTTNTSQYMGFNHNSGKYTFEVDYPTGGSTILPSGQTSGDALFHHIVVTRLDNNLSIYVDGVLRNTTTANFSKNTGFNTNTIGNLYRASAGNYYTGLLDDVFVYNKTLTSDDILHLYNTSLTKFNTTQFYYNTSETVVATPQSYYLCSSNATAQSCSSSNSIIEQETLKTNFSNSIGNIRNEMFGANVNGYLANGAYANLSDLSISSNVTWHRNAFINGGFTVSREDINLESLYSNTSDSSGVNFTGNVDNITLQNAWAQLNNIKILRIIDYMPSFLSDNSSGVCSVYTKCPANNLTKFANIVKDYINRTTNNGQYLNATEYEFWNEPEGNFMDLLSNDHVNKSIQLNALFNATATIVRLSYPTAIIGGMGVLHPETGGSVNMFNNFIGNFSVDLTALNHSDFISFHKYMSPSFFDTDDYMGDLYGDILTVCLGLSANCSRLVLSEFNLDHVTDDAYIRNSSARSNEYATVISQYYTSALNTYPSSIQLNIYQWSANYVDPAKWEVVNEPLFLNSYQIPYNVTKNFAHLCPAGGSVYVSTSDDDEVKVVSCKNSTNYGIIVINAGSESKNVTWNGTETQSADKAYLMNIDTGDLYLNNETNQLGILEAYDIVYLHTPSYRVSENDNTTKVNFEGTEYSGNEMYFTEASNNTHKHLASTLLLSVTGNVTFNVDSCNDVGNIYYTPNGGSRTEYQRGSYTCSNNQVTINSLTIAPSLESNEFEIEYGCSTTTRAGYNLVMIFASLGLILFASWTAWNGYKNNDLDIGKLVIFFIVLIVSIALWSASGQNLGASCGPVG